MRKEIIPALINRLFSLSFMGGLGINFFKSEWSYAQFKVAEGDSLCAFSEDA